MPTKLRIGFIALFFGLTILPILQMLTGALPDGAVVENRSLAPPASRDTPLNQIPKVAGRWFSDHFGLRATLIKLKTQIDFSLFGTSDRVLVGKDGQLFYRSTINSEEPAIERLLVKDEAHILNNIDRFTNALADKGIRTAIVVNMMSERFYPELLPPSAVHRAAEPRIDDLVAHIRRLPNVLFIDSTDILKRILLKRRIFLKTDFHWNDPAAFSVAKSLVDQISIVEHKPSSPWSYPLEIDTAQFSGGIAWFLPLFFPPYETSLLVKQTWTWPASFSLTQNQGIFEQITSAAPDTRLLPPVVLLGDSFLDGMLRSGLQANFVETHRVRWKKGLKISDLASNLPVGTRWLVIQFVEISFWAMEAFADEKDIDDAISVLRVGHAGMKEGGR